MGKPSSVTHSVDWLHQGGTRICAEFHIEPGNNNVTPADIEQVFAGFCNAMRDTLLVKQENTSNDSDG